MESTMKEESKKAAALVGDFFMFIEILPPILILGISFYSFHQYFKSN